MRIGVLAIQGSFSLHLLMLDKLGVNAVAIKKPQEIEGLDGLIMPGGESTTFSKVFNKFQLFNPIREAINNGLPIWGTCAGAIMLGYGSGIPTLRLNVSNVEISRNGWGRQVDSFVTDLSIDSMADIFHGVFIRAPRILKVGENVEVLSRINGEPVMTLEKKILLTTFHPELTSDLRIHEYFIENLCNNLTLKRKSQKLELSLLN